MVESSSAKCVRYAKRAAVRAGDMRRRGGARKARAREKGEGVQRLRAQNARIRSTRMREIERSDRDKMMESEREEMR